MGVDQKHRSLRYSDNDGILSQKRVSFFKFPRCLFKKVNVLQEKQTYRLLKGPFAGMMRTGENDGDCNSILFKVRPCQRYHSGDGGGGRRYGRLNRRRTFFAKKADILILGGAPYANVMDRKLRAYAEAIDPSMVSKIVLFTTSNWSRRTVMSLRRILERKGIEVEKRYFYAHMLNIQNRIP